MLKINNLLQVYHNPASIKSNCFYTYVRIYVNINMWFVFHFYRIHASNREKEAIYDCTIGNSSKLIFCMDKLHVALLLNKMAFSPFLPAD